MTCVARSPQHLSRERGPYPTGFGRHRRVLRRASLERGCTGCRAPGPAEIVISSTAAVDEMIERAAAVNLGSFEQLMRLESHPGRTLLQSDILIGRSRLRWARACEGLDALWALHHRHTATLAALRAVRRRRHRLTAEDLRTLRRLVYGADAPAAPRSLIAVEITITRRGGEVLDVLRGADLVWSRLGSAVERCRALLATAREDAADPATGAALVDLHTRLEALGETVLRDPLAFCRGLEVDTRRADALQTECAVLAACAGPGGRHRKE